MKQFFGKYRGKVENNNDLDQIGRTQVSCPAVLGEGRLSWAMPCAPLANDGSGIYAVPQIGSNVWVEFEGGDPDYPIYSGSFWNKSEQVPTDAKNGVPTSPSIVLQTHGGQVLTMNDIPGDSGFTLKAKGGACITVNDQGITIDNGQGAKITLTGNTVDINGGALTIT